MKKIIDWLLESNRLWHLGLGFLYGLAASDWYCAIYGGVGVAGALEFKDWQWGGKPDGVDLLLTMGGVFGGYFVISLIL